ncbi:monooxygenase Mical, partial [Clarias magur]
LKNTKLDAISRPQDPMPCDCILPPCYLIKAMELDMETMQESLEVQLALTQGTN